MRAPDEGGNPAAHQWQSVALSEMRSPEALSRNQPQSAAISRNQPQSAAIRGSHLLAGLERISFLSELAFLADGRGHCTLTQRDSVLPGT